MKFYKIKKNKGFTLVEIMVATSIFMVIMLVALGALISSSNTAKQAQALRLAMDNINFAMESMTRSLRMGTNYACITSTTFSLPMPSTSTSDCPIGGSGGVAVAFTPALHDPLAIDTAYVVADRNNGSNTSSLQRCDPKCVDLVSPDVNIKKLTFYVTGSNLADTIQPSVYILIKGTVTVKGTENSFAIQTMASQRSGE